MPCYVAFLRAINVGGRVVKMERLRGIFEEIGLERVETFIASGNVIFHSGANQRTALERRIESALAGALGYDVDTFVRTPAEIAAAAAFPAFADLLETEPLYIGFLGTEPSAAVKTAVGAFRTEVDDFRVNGREIYWRCRVGMGKSLVTGPRLEKLLGMPSTMRNVTTVRKLAAKYPPAERPVSPRRA